MLHSLLPILIVILCVILYWFVMLLLIAMTVSATHRLERVLIRGSMLLWTVIALLTLSYVLKVPLN
jgi:hypothetical protein